jgi:hypothetical protein
MQTAGFGEERQDGLAFDPKDLVGQVRRLSEFGPAYEVVKLVSGSRALIRVFSTGEEVELRIEDIVTDPISETIP